MTQAVHMHGFSFRRMPREQAVRIAPVMGRVADELRTLRTALDEPPAMALAVPSQPEHASLARELLTMVIALVEQLVALLLWPLRAVDRLLLSGAD